MATTTAAQTILRNIGGKLQLDGAELPQQYWELIERYRSDLTNQALAIIGNLQDAEDVVQETFCEAFRDSEKLREARSLGAWLRGINKNKALNRVRDKRQESKRIINPPRMDTTGGFSVLEMRESVAKAIETLPNNLREVIVLRYWDQLSYEEIAARLNIPSGTVGRLLHDASVKLYEKLNVQIKLGALPSETDSSKEQG
jgi:RNA polymerase sigma-70 factor (ECF subfamily)